MGLHWQELVILLILALVIFGPKRLPEIGRSLGKGIREFKGGMSNATAEMTSATEPIQAEVEGRTAAGAAAGASASGSPAADEPAAASAPASSATDRS